MQRRIINIDPEILGGTPVFYGTRVPIKNLFDYLESGDSIEIFLDDFDGVTKSQVIKVLEMSQKLIKPPQTFSMKILLDECVTKRLKKQLSSFEVFTVRELGLGGIKNGKLMTYCLENGFDILLTIDKNLMFQQNLEKYPGSIVVLNCVSSKIEELITFLPSFFYQINKMEKHKAYLIDKN